jgi:integrase
MLVAAPNSFGTLKRLEGLDRSEGFSRGEGLPGRALDGGCPILMRELDASYFQRSAAAPEAGVTILEGCAEELGLYPADYGTHSMRRTKATLIYRRTKNLRAVQLLLGHSKLESTVRIWASR